MSSVGYMEKFMDLEHKFARFGDGLSVTDGAVIEGYASLFGQVDQGSDVVRRGGVSRVSGWAGQGRSAGQDAVAARPDAAHRCLG